VWEGEDDVGVPDRQQLAFALDDPLVARVRQAFWAMPIATANGELSITCLDRRYRGRRLASAPGGRKLVECWITRGRLDWNASHFSGAWRPGRVAPQSRDVTFGLRTGCAVTM
jgi:hypothetical protein